MRTCSGGEEPATNMRPARTVAEQRPKRVGQVSRSLAICTRGRRACALNLPAGPRQPRRLERCAFIPESNLLILFFSEKWL